MAIELRIPDVAAAACATELNVVVAEDPIVGRKQYDPTHVYFVFTATSGHAIESQMTSLAERHGGEFRHI